MYSTSSQCPSHPPGADPIAAAWAEAAPDLAVWVDQHLLNRRDVHGAYGPTRTAHQPLNVGTLEHHFRGGSPEDIVGFHITSPDNTCKAVVIDIDAHTAEADPGANLAFARSLHDLLISLGFTPLLVDTNGKGGFHVIILFAPAIPGETAHRLGRWLSWPHAAYGLKERPESFPKSPDPTTRGKGFGNFVRLFGRHYKHDHWSKVWDGCRWLDGEDAILRILETRGDSPDRIPPEVMQFDPDPPREAKPADPGGPGEAMPAPWTQPDDPDRKAADAADALGCLPADDYDFWVRMGMCLTELGPAGLAIWEAWSATSGKYRPGECRAKWLSFTPGAGVTLGTLFHEAIRAGWRRPAPGPNHTPCPGSNGQAMKASHSPRILANYRTEKRRGKVEIRVGLQPDAIAKALAAFTGDWPKCVGRDPFARGAEDHPLWLHGPADLFAWARSQGIEVLWAKGTDKVTQEHFCSYIGMTRPSYDVIELLPHQPEMPRTYYMHPAFPPGDGRHLDGLLDRFCPATEQDRELIRAFLLTLFWGGPPGSRPGFLVTAPEDDPRRGRGVGKTTIIKVAALLVTGYLDISPKEPMADVKTRLLSSEAVGKRLCLLDNLKSLKFTWAELESMITCDTISGHKMYKGEGRRPNTLVWALTLNGASLSSDMAQRVVTIMVGRPKRTATWEDQTRAYATENRVAIIGDILAALRGPGATFAQHSRWTIWEAAVLSRCSDPEACQKLIVQRAAAIDDDAHEAGLVRDYFVGELWDRGHNPDAEKVFIPSAQAALWVHGATGEKKPVNVTMNHLYSLPIAEIRKSKSNVARGCVWTGNRIPDPNAPAVRVKPAQGGSSPP